MTSFVNICPKLMASTGDNNGATQQMVSIDLKTSVKTLSQLVGQRLGLNEDKFDLMCFGRILSSDQLLDSYGITNGTTVFVLNKTNFTAFEDNSDADDAMDTRPPISQSDVQHMVIALRTALMDDSFRLMLQKLSDEEFRENLMAVTPGLREDITAQAILQDFDLLGVLTEPTNIHRVLAQHPCLLDAATFLSATFHEEIISKEATAGSRPQNYMLDDPLGDTSSDDEPTAESNSESNQTARQIASALVDAYRVNQNRSNRPPMTTSSGLIITPDMLRNAIRNSGPTTSTAASAVAPTPVPSTSTSTSGGTGARIRGWATQLQQMRDMGIDDEIVAIQALEATNGDVQAALNIIFSDTN